MNRSTASAPSMEERMASLKTRFLEETLAQASELAELAHSLTDNKETRDHREAIRRIAHRLAGRAGLFGLGHLTERATQLEDCILRDRSDADIGSLALATVADIRRSIPAGNTE